MKSVNRVVFTGPESCGKSFSSQFVAKNMNLSWVKEYARDYLEKLDRAYTMQDVLNIARGQFALETELRKISIKPLICDTDLTVIYVWLKFKYDIIDDFVMDVLKKKATKSFYFLCYPDLPWEPDPLRENPNTRMELFEMYEALLLDLNTKYYVLKGSLEQRNKICLDIMNEIIQ